MSGQRKDYDILKFYNHIYIYNNILYIIYIIYNIIYIYKYITRIVGISTSALNDTQCIFGASSWLTQALNLASKLVSDMIFYRNCLLQTWKEKHVLVLCLFSGPDRPDDGHLPLAKLQTFIDNANTQRAKTDRIGVNCDTDRIV